MNKKIATSVIFYAFTIFFTPLACMVRQEFEIKEKHDHALEETVQEGNATWVSAHSRRTYPLMGLSNDDNRCYLNACLQALFASPYFTEFIDYPIYQKKSVGEALQQFYTRYLGQLTGVTTSDVLKQALVQLHTEGKFHINVAQDQQEDAAEVLNKVLEVITPDLAHPQTNPFCIQEIGEFRCGTCNQVYEKELDDYKFSTILTLPITYTTLERCIDEYFTGIIAKRCCSARNTLHTKKTKLKKAPGMLCIALNRFSYTNEGGCIKNNDFVSLPVNLDMQAYTEKEDTSAVYDLSACVMHRGNDLNHGHYVAYIKRNSHWYLCNDTGITQLPLTFDINKDLSHADKEVAYILLYEKQGAARELQRKQKENPQPWDKKPIKDTFSFYGSCKTIFLGSPQRKSLSFGFVAIAFILVQKFFLKK